MEIERVTVCRLRAVLADAVPFMSGTPKLLVDELDESSGSPVSG
jgi:hypothetical protein